MNSGRERRILALIKKEMLQIYRDPSSIITAFVFPLVLLFLYGFGVSLDMNGIQVGIVIEDESPIARSFVRSLMGTSYFKTHTFTHRKEAEEAVSSGTINGFAVIPIDFSKSFNTPSKTALIQVIADGSEPNTAQFLQNYVRGASLTWLQELSIENRSPIPRFASIVPRVWYNQELSSRHFLIPGSIVVIMTVMGALLTSMVVAREWERGTMESLMSTPTTMEEVILSKLVAYFLLGIAAMALCYFVAEVLYQVPFRGSYFALTLVSVAYLIFALGMGLLISLSTRDQFAASQIAVVSTYLPAFILSGFIFDTTSMPLYLRILTHFVPAKYFVDSLKTLFLVGTVWEVLLPNLLVMILFSTVIYFFIRKKCVKRLEA